MRSDRVVLEASLDYWDKSRFPRLQRIIFDNTLEQREAVELVKTTEGVVDVVTELSPLDTLRVAQSPFAQVVKTRGPLVSVFGQFNMRKPSSPWRDSRLRKAINLAINRADLIRYATKGNGVVIPALIPVQGFGYDPDLAPYPFDPDKAQHLLREAGYPDGFPLILIAPEDLEVQATVVSKMLEQAGLQVELQILDPVVYSRKTFLSHLDQPAEQQTWDIALISNIPDVVNFPVYMFYHNLALDGTYDWVVEQPELRQLYEQVLDTVDREHQQALIRQIERHTYDQAYFLFLYNPIQLYAVNKAVEFVPHVTTLLTVAETSVSADHWSVRQDRLSPPSTGVHRQQADPRNTEQVTIGQAVYAQHCASCHGKNLEGQSNWRQRLPTGHYPAPPHDETGHTWHHPDRYLFETIKYGWQRFAPPGYQSTMQGFQEVLSDEEIWAVLAFIKSRWPLTIQAQQEQLNRREQAVQQQSGGSVQTPRP